jgi:hypothetical protein
MYSECRRLPVTGEERRTKSCTDVLMQDLTPT